MTTQPSSDPSMTLPPDSSSRPRRHRPHFGTGLFLILLGVIFALHQWDLFPLQPFHHLWPLILIALGLARMVDKGVFATGPHVLIFVGLFFELRNLGGYEWVDRAWPLGLVWIGLLMTWRALRPHKKTICEWMP